MSDKEFCARISRGYIFKNLIETFAAYLKRPIFTLSKKGIFSTIDDSTEDLPISSILFNVCLLRENFDDNFICVKDIHFSINVKHLQKLIKNVKKKNGLSLYIEKNEPNKLYICIEPSENESNSSLSETISVEIVRLNDYSPIEPPPDEDGDVKCYHPYPKNVNSQDFQKLKKMSTIGKEISITMQLSNYISFSSESGNIFGSKLEFGTLTHTPEVDFDDFESASEYPGVYKARFSSSKFAHMMKLPAATKIMHFYMPRIKGFPLKIKMQAGTLGTVSIYMKDAVQVDFENSEYENEHHNESQTSKKSRK